MLWEKEKLLITSNFSFSHSVFKRLLLQTRKKPGLVWERVNSSPNDKFLDWSKLEALADNRINVIEKSKFVFGTGRKHCGKRRKCWLPAFSPFLTMFSIGLFLRVVISQVRPGGSVVSASDS